MPRAQALHSWVESQNPEQLRETLQSLSIRSGGGGGALSNAPYKTLAQGRDEQVGKGNQASFFSVRVGSDDFTVTSLNQSSQAKATVMMIKHDENAVLYYNACPTTGCAKKVTQNERGQWYCVKCNKEYPTSEARFVTNICLADYTGAFILFA